MQAILPQPPSRLTTWSRCATARMAALWLTSAHHLHIPGTTTRPTSKLASTHAMLMLHSLCTFMPAHYVLQDPSSEEGCMGEGFFGTQVPAAGGLGCGAWSDMDEDEDGGEEAAMQAPWQAFPYPGELDVEE